MSIETTTYIPRQNFNKWYECFKSTTGRLLRNPIDGGRVLVVYSFDSVCDSNKFDAKYQSISTPINETTRSYSIIHKAKVFLKAI